MPVIPAAQEGEIRRFETSPGTQFEGSYLKKSITKKKKMGVEWFKV
jgi:hypothetical protein